MAQPPHEPGDRPSEDPTRFCESPPPVATYWRGGAPPSLPCRLGRYELLSQIGRGGMGAVYLAHDTRLNRRVALKTPHFGGSRPDVTRERFFREAHAAANINHPNICPIHDVDEIEGVPILAMAYVEGMPLSAYIRPDRPFPEREAADLVRQIALAMQEAHRAGIVHRDLKPSNIMISRQDQPVVMDFGLASLGPNPDTRITDSGTTVGTPAYMPPEQINADAALIGVGCDIYSLGVILFEILTGRLPFRGKRGELMAQVLYAIPPAPARFRPELSPALESICLTALQKHPSDRFHTMQEFADALGDFLAGREVARAPIFRQSGLMPATIMPAPAAESATKRSDPTERMSAFGHWKPTKKLAWLIAFAVVAVGIFALTQRRTREGHVLFAQSERYPEATIRIGDKVLPPSAGERMASMTPGDYTVEIIATGFEPFVRFVTVVADETRVIKVEMAAKPPRPESKPPEDLPNLATLTELESILDYARKCERLNFGDLMEQAAKKAVQLKRDSPDAWLMQARAEMKTHQREAAEYSAKRALKLVPADKTVLSLEIRCLLAKSYLEQRNFADCIKTCDEVIEQEQGNGRFAQNCFDNRSKARIKLLTADDYRKALSDCNKAARIALGPDQATFLMRKASLHERLGELNEAKATRDEARRRDPYASEEFVPPLPKNAAP